MTARLKLSEIGKIQILSNQETTCFLSFQPNLGIGFSGQSFIPHSIRIMAASYE